jgi:U3 small nucleolar RNA-associated protein 6
MRIMLIYERAVTRFKGDLELWLRYAEYCRSQGSRRVQKVISALLIFRFALLTGLVVAFSWLWCC